MASNGTNGAGGAPPRPAPRSPANSNSAEDDKDAPQVVTARPAAEVISDIQQDPRYQEAQMGGSRPSSASSSTGVAQKKGYPQGGDLNQSVVGAPMIGQPVGSQANVVGGVVGGA